MRKFFRNRIEEKQPATILQGYIETISIMLSEKGLRESTKDSEVRRIAQTLTISTLKELDKEDKGNLLQFLYKARLIDEGGNNGNFLLGADFKRADFTRANLRGATLIKSCLIGIDLMGADLTRADLMGSDLTGSNLAGAILMGANLTDATLLVVNLTDANLREAILTNTDLTDADLTEAFL